MVKARNVGMGEGGGGGVEGVKRTSSPSPPIHPPPLPLFPSLHPRRFDDSFVHTQGTPQTSWEKLDPAASGPAPRLAGPGDRQRVNTQ